MSAINELTERERDILILRYGLNKNGPMTLDEIGKGYGLTRERIRQIEYKALGKLRNLRDLLIIFNINGINIWYLYLFNMYYLFSNIHNRDIISMKWGIIC